MILLMAFVFSILLTPFSMYLADRLGAIDCPNERSVHSASIPRLGGVGISLSVLFAVAFYLPVNEFSFGFLTGFAIIIVIGLVDDIKPMSHRLKFIGEAVAAISFVSISGSELTGFGNLLGFGEIVFGPFSFIVTVFCIVGLINAMNLCDGLDGLAGGLAIIASSFFALLAFMSHQQDVLVISLAMAGSLLGFLMYNSFPARLFMGDTGSLMIGYTCAVLAVHLTDGGGSMLIQPITIAMVLAVPLLDTLVVMGKRILHGESPFLPDNTHLHHRLMGMGLSQNQSVSVLYILMFMYGFVALVGLKVEASWQFYGAILGISLVYFFIARVRDYPWTVVTSISRFSSFLERLEYRQHERLIGLWAYFRKGLPIVILVLFFLPLFFMQGELYFLAALFLALIFILLLQYDNVRIVALLHGLLYLSVFSVLYQYQDGWLQGYSSGLAYVSMVWVILSLFVGRTRKIITMHSFEILLVLTSWLGTFMLMPMVQDNAVNAGDMHIVCIYAIPMLFMVKLALSGIQDFIAYKHT